MPKQIHIASIADEKYKRCQMAMVSSAIASAGAEYMITFHLYRDEFSPETICDFERFIGRHGHRLHWLNDASGGLDIPLTMYFSRAASLRLFLAEMVDADVAEIVYLDADVVLAKDGIARLYAVELSGAPVAAVAEAEFDLEYRAYRTGIEDRNYRYFNSGVLVINLNRWRETRASEHYVRIMNERGKRLKYVDQDVLNIHWQRDVRYLPLEFNLTSAYYAFPAKYLASLSPGGYGVSEIQKALAHPVAIHFYGFMHNRPWFTPCYHPEKQRYVDAANDSPYPFVCAPSPRRERNKYIRLHWIGYPEMRVKFFIAHIKTEIKKALTRMH